MAPAPSTLVTLTGPDRPGIAAWLFAALEPLGASVLDVEQVRVHGRLLLCVELDAGPGRGPLLEAALNDGRPVELADLVLTVAPLAGRDDRHPSGRQLVTVLGPRLGSHELGAVFSLIAGAGGNADRIVQLSRYPVTSYQLVVSGGDADRLRRDLAAQAGPLGVDVAVQRAGLHRRAKHLIVLDADSTLLQGEVIDLLAARAGRADEVRAVTEAAMAGELDFGQALAERVALLTGLPEEVLDAVAADLVLAPGARTLVRTLRRLGYVTAVVSGGFIQVVAGLAADLGIDHVAANTLEVADGRLTGGLVGPVIDRAGKAAALVRFAGMAGVPLTQTVAVGDGANDLDMLAVAGLGIAYNAKPVVRQAADATLNVPYLDAILFLLGIPREEIEAADDEEGVRPARPVEPAADPR
jgi:phosphoserine phosphatase